ncbi:hypothetical protein ABT300_18800 [Streptomyces sp. NPDC001027]|uniref:hypothetical protein n=1 Tax=Streptomyces sp. NPDC001027 TaxID=3154771 RepID=UPI003320087A
MSDQAPSRPAYRLPDSGALGAATDTTLKDAERAHEQLGRVMVVVTAAAVRDILTGCKPDAPFDAAAVELVEGADGSLFPNGRYWTLAGDERTFTETVGLTEAGNGIHDMSGWTAYLDDNTQDVWRPLCTELPDRNGRPAYRLDLLRAAAVTLDGPVPVPAARPLSTMVDVMVCANDVYRYPALVDPAVQRDGFVKPWFDLDTVRRIAADTQADAARFGHGSIDTVHVLDGMVERKAQAVVLVISWMYIGGGRNEKATEILQPNADGRYAIGGLDWCWYVVGDDLTPQIPFQPEAV